MLANTVVGCNNFTQQNSTDSRYNSYMQKLRKVNTDNYNETLLLQNAISKSPIRRNNLNTHITAKSPIRSRTPNQNVSPIKPTPQLPTSIRFIANVSPLRERPTQQDNFAEIANGKHIKYIHQISERGSDAARKDKGGKTERVTQEENRLFGKLVDKLNSEKKNPKSNESSYRTSIFAENTDLKQKTDGFKPFSNQVKTGETKSQLRPNIENDNTSCLMYRMRTNSRNELVEKPSIMPSMRRKLSKFEENAVKQQDEDYTEFNILLQKAAANIPVAIARRNDEEVKQSLRVMGSLNMDPFL